MPDITTIAAALTSFNTLKDIAKSMINLRDAQAIQGKIAEFNWQIADAQTKIFAVNEERTALIKRVSELEKNITRMKNWETEKQRYELAAPFPGCMVYALKKSMSGGQTAHYLCASCYQKGEPSILQGSEAPRTKSGIGFNGAFYACSICGTKAVTTWANVTPPQYFEDITPQP